MSIINIESENQFELEVLKSLEPVLVDFYADWCGPCKMVAPVLEEIAKESDARIAKINIDQQPNLASRYGILSIPTFIVFQEGKEIKKMVGVKSKQELLDSLS